MQFLSNVFIKRRITPIFLEVCSTRMTSSAAQFQSETNLLTFDPTVTEIKPRCYPQAWRGNVSDNYHGTTVFDPYRALEDPDAEDTKKFVTQLNSLSEPFLEACPVRDKLREKLTKLWDYEKFSCTSIRGNFFYYYHNTGLQNHFVLFQQKSLEEKGTIFLDPNTFSEDGTTALSVTAWTKDGQILAYGISEKGSDLVSVKFKMCSGEELSDRIPRIKFSGIAWLHDNSGLFYSSYPELRNVAEDSKEDILVVQSRENPDKMLGAEVSDDGRFLFVTVRNGCDPKNQLFYYDLSSVGYKITEKIELLPLFDKCDAEYEIMDSDENSALILTNHEAPMFKLVRVKLGLNGGENQNELWQVVVGEDELRKLEWASPVDKDKLIVCYMEDVKNTLYIHSIDDGRMLYQLPLPIGSLSGVFARKSMSKIFVGFESFLVPTVVFHGDFSNCPSRESPVELREIRRINVPGLDYKTFEAKQVFYPSKDGTQIPMYVVHRKDMQLDGSNATILNGYGGFSISQLPSFSVSRLMLVQHFGFVWATANIRGGSEYGEKWHEAGMRDRKQTVFDDFIAAAEFLISNKYTCNKKLAIQGGSNGGLLTAACCQQRPDLFAAVVTRVGVLDMLRFNKFTIGAAWVKEFGDPDEPDDFPFIYEYSPLHRLSLTHGKNWPATLLMSADHDDRVVPLHTLKYIAQLYHLLRTEAEEWQRKPVLARIEVKAGHGAGKPTAKMIAELVDLYCFLQRVLELKWND
uniref:Prolyl endopeptidase n=1 Tax=Globodera rostochiensis TaxID=31243 RepID=A0A914GW39_GLORO